MGELPKLKGTFCGVDCFSEMLAKLVFRIMFSKSTLADFSCSFEFTNLFVFCFCRNPPLPAAIYAIHATGAMVIFLPPYSPDFMPSEALFAQVKEMDPRKGRSVAIL